VTPPDIAAEAAAWGLERLSRTAWLRSPAPSPCESCAAQPDAAADAAAEAGGCVFVDSESGVEVSVWARRQPGPTPGLGPPVSPAAGPER
jgi:hypothetical protein